ncbi:MAG TPA: NADH-quinone oxidoreductase subunit NuoG [Coxiellaceae bacterium]|nr:NADH-quinone oxidoreductase subunit NuoG [Coxiellaceae bacterium]
MIELEINHQKVSIQEGATVIEAADQIGIYIPRFCYHRKLSIVANCRMCLVEIEGVAKALPACATLVTAGMKVYTASQKALDAQRAVMEFLLINHPLDCPICDQGGECQLQDQSMGYGYADSEYDQTKRAVYSDDLGPLVETEMTRCIHCTRCVRFGIEVAGLPEIGATFRGEDMEIGTYVKHFMHSEVSGNIIDLCPVGALTSKPFDYSARAWEMQEHPSIAPHDCVGSHLFVHTRAQDNLQTRRVMRVVPRAHESVNEVWLSDRDRFSYQALHHEDRVLQPMVKRNGQWKTIDWQAALLEVVDRTRAIINLQGAEQLAALASPNSTLEEFYLLQKLFRALGSNNIDHRLTQQDLTATPEFGLGMSFADMDDLNAVLLVGSNIRQEQPLLSARLFKAYKKGAKLMALNMMDYEFVYPLSEKMRISSKALPKALVEIACALAELTQQAIELPKVKVSETARAIAENLRQAPKKAILMGADAINHPQASLIRELLQLIAQLSQASLGALSVGANSLGAWIADMVPYQGSNAREVLDEKPVRAYYLLGIEPEFDSAYPAAALKALKEAGLVVCLSTFKTQAMLDYADFILPTAPFTENAGTLVNAQGDWQSFTAASVPHGEAKPAWKIIRALASLFELDGFDYQKSQDVIAELKLKAKNQHLKAHQPDLAKLHFSEESELIRFAPTPIYRGDALLRRAQALQKTQFVLEPQLATIQVNTKTAQALGLRDNETVMATQGDSKLHASLTINDRLADHMVLLPLGLAETAGFGAAFAAIHLQRGEA